MTSLDQVVAQALAGDQRAIARLATRVENDPGSSQEYLEALYPFSGRAHVIGVTGPPGAGKSSVLAGLAKEFSARKKRFAVVAVDPSSPRTGGATLGDRIRMGATALDPNVFVRSVASRERNDGLAPSVAALALLFDAVGYDYVAIETVGSGQDQLEIADLVHTTILVQIPGTGDSVQLLKAGSMEIADIYVVNKADLPGASRVSRDLRTMLGLAAERVSDWEPPIVLTSAVEETGFDTLANAIESHFAFLASENRLGERRWHIARSELKRAIARQTRLQNSPLADALIGQLADRTITPEQAAIAFLAALDQIPPER